MKRNEKSGGILLYAHIGLHRVHLVVTSVCMVLRVKFEIEFEICGRGCVRQTLSH